MIHLSSVSIRNFLSWGDYDTIVPLDNRGQCFISGPNGAGKSSLFQSILWCLSGKTMYKSNPGNGVLNWFGDQNCRVQLPLGNGSTLTRVRTRSGDTELLYSKDGVDVINCTLSTTSNQQRVLERELGFDYEAFCGSVFFNQFRHRWLEMGDQSRKQVLERIMGIDRLSVYAEVAKKRRDGIETEQAKLNGQLDGAKSTLSSLSETFEESMRLSSEFRQRQRRKEEEKKILVKQYETQIGNFEIIDIKRLTGQWEIVKKIRSKIDSMKTAVDSLTDDMDALRDVKDDMDDQLEGKTSKLDDAYDKKNDELQNDFRNRDEPLQKKCRSHQKTLEKQILGHKGVIAEAKATTKQLASTVALWKSKGGKVCTECEQEIPHKHTDGKIIPIESQISQGKTIVEAELVKIAELEKAITDNQLAYDVNFEEEQHTLDMHVEDVEKERSAGIVALRKEYDTTENEDQHHKAQKKRDKLKNDAEAAEEKLSNVTPDKTIETAEAENSRLETLEESLETTRAELENVGTEKDTHKKMADETAAKVKTQEDKIGKILESVQRYDLAYRHFNYVYKAYSDRRKIKSFLIGRHKPFFNSRLSHYLDSFGLDVKISLSSSLGIESNYWGYEYQSGGESARTNLAFMFSVFDLHSGIHGRQCNILVLDEPDHHLDSDGQDALITIIKEDLACRFETIFIISHNKSFRDVFPGQITVHRDERLSYIADER